MSDIQRLDSETDGNHEGRYFCPMCGERHGCQQTKVDRLRADLAAAQRERDEATADNEVLRRMVAALSAGGTDPDEGDRQ